MKRVTGRGAALRHADERRADEDRGAFRGREDPAPLPGESLPRNVQRSADAGAHRAGSARARARAGPRAGELLPPARAVRRHGERSRSQLLFK